MRRLRRRKYPTRNFETCWATNMRLLASALLLLLVADFSLAGVHRLSTEQLQKSDLWKDTTAHVLLFPEEGTLNNVNAGHCGASVRECGCFCSPPPDLSYLQARLSIFCHPSSTTIVGLAHAYPMNCMGGTNFCAKSLHFSCSFNGSTVLLHTHVC